MSEANLIPAQRIERKILLLRGEKVMLDSDLAELYGVETKALNQAVKRNLERFPADFMFQVSSEEAQLVMWSQIVTTSASRRRASHRPYAFTEQGVAMLSSVLRSDRAIQVNLAIMRTFVQLRQMFATHSDLARKLAALERKYDSRFKIVFDALREMMVEKKKPKREIGFHAVVPRKKLRKN